MRDRLSHGEVNLYSVPASLVHPVVCLSVFLCHKFIKESYKVTRFSSAVIITTQNTQHNLNYITVAVIPIYQGI